MSVMLWIAAALRMLTAIFAACSVNEDSSNAGMITVLTLLFFAGAVIDAFAAIYVGDSKQRSRVRYVGGCHEHK